MGQFRDRGRCKESPRLLEDICPSPCAAYSQCARCLAGCKRVRARCREKKPQELWISGESNLVHRITLAQRTCLSAFFPDTIRRAAREFSTHAAMSTDGFAMSHFALLSDDALTLASQFCEVSKAMAQAWENLHLRFFFLRPAKDDQSPTIWRHAAAVVCGVDRGEETVSVWRDCMEHHILQANAQTFGFLCLSFELPCQATECNACWSSMARQPPTGRPSRGVVVGSAIATYLVKLYCLLVFGQCCAAASFG